MVKKLNLPISRRLVSPTRQQLGRRLNGRNWGGKRTLV